MGNPNKRQTSRTGATLVVALLIFGICAFASAVLVAYNRDTIDALLVRWQGNREAAATKKAAVENRKVQRGHGIASWSMQRLIASPDPVSPRSEFSLADKFAVTDFCTLFKNLAPSDRLKWDKSVDTSKSADCAGQMDVPARQDDNIHNSLFVQVRHNAAGASATVRLKLIYLPDRAEPTFRNEFVAGAAAALNALFSTGPTEIKNKIESLTPFSVALSGVSIKLFKEQLVPGAYNLMIDARCGKHGCAATNPFYSLNMPRNPSADEPPAATETLAQ